MRVERRADRAGNVDALATERDRATLEPGQLEDAAGETAQAHGLVVGRCRGAPRRPAGRRPASPRRSPGSPEAACAARARRRRSGGAPSRGRPRSSRPSRRTSCRGYPISSSPCMPVRASRSPPRRACAVAVICSIGLHEPARVDRTRDRREDDRHDRGDRETHERALPELRVAVGQQRAAPVRPHAHRADLLAVRP